jgi:sugar lactone lactonase YvrE
LNCRSGTKVRMVAQLLYNIPCTLGEGPVWHSARRSVFWVDIEGQYIFELQWETRIFKEWKIPYRVSLILPTNHNRLILGLQGGIAEFDLQHEKLKWLLDIDRDLPHNRCNDGACDSKGRLWVGTMDLDFKAGAGSLYCVENLLPIKKIGQVTISNGLAWSLDNKKVFYIDSPTQTIQSYHFDLDSGALSFEREVCKIPKKMGTPDGMCIDREGMLWVAHWGGFGVYRWNPSNGKCIDRIEVNAPNVSSCAFVGDNLDYLVITSARQQLSINELKEYPNSGSLFYVRMGVKGIARNNCNL